MAERAEKLDKTNKQILNEKLLAFQAQENEIDKSISDLAMKNISFIKAVLESLD